jgi:hypothetical protein
MEPLVRGVTDEIQTFFAFVVGKGLRAQCLPVKVGKETMVGQIMGALTPIDVAGAKVFWKENTGMQQATSWWTRDNSFRSALWKD